MEYGKRIRLGGFHLLKHKRDEMTFIKVSSIMGHWELEYREDTVMFAHLDSDYTEEEGKALHYILINAFMASTIVDGRFHSDILDAAGRLQERMNMDAEKVSDEEDAEILKAMKTEAEMLEHLDGEEGDKTNAEV